MPILFRQKKKKRVRSDHPIFESGEPKKLLDRDRERDLPKVRRNLIAIIAVMILIAAVLIAFIVGSLAAPAGNGGVTISAADTFAITPYEQDLMSSKTEEFAKYMLLWAYCSDQDTANSAKTAALSLMVPGTSSYTAVQNSPQVYPVIAPDNFVPVVTEPRTSNFGVTVAQSLTFSCDAAAADSSVVSSSNPNGTFADAGLSITVEFSHATDETVETVDWMISSVTIQSKNMDRAYVEDEEDGK